MIFQILVILIIIIIYPMISKLNCILIAKFNKKKILPIKINLKLKIKIENKKIKIKKRVIK